MGIIIGTGGAPKSRAEMEKEADQQWIRSCRFKRFSTMMYEAFEVNRPARIEYIIENYPEKLRKTRDMRAEWLSSAIEHGADVPIRLFLDRYGHDYSRDPREDCEQAKRLVRKALGKGGPRVAKVVAALARAELGHDNAGAVATVCALEHTDRADVVHAVLEELRAPHVEDCRRRTVLESYFEHIYDEGGDTEMLAHTIDIVMPQHAKLGLDIAKLLRYTLHAALYDGDMQILHRTIAHINTLPAEERAAVFNANTMSRAVDNLPAVLALHAAGAPVEGIAEKLARKISDAGDRLGPEYDGLRQALDGYLVLEQQRRDEEERQRQAEEKYSDYTVESPDTLGHSQRLGNGIFLTNAFNFTLRQQTTVTRYEKSVAVAVRGFDEIAPDVVRHMRDILVTLGGTPPEAETLQKPLPAPHGIRRPNA